MRSTTARSGFRCLAGAVVTAAVLATTSGCTAPVDAVAGVSVTGDGQLLGVMMVCGHRIDGATLYVDDAHADKSVTVGSWTARHPLTHGLTTWPLQAPAAGWTATKPLGPLASRTTYTLYGWTNDNSSSGSISFTSADRSRLSPGRILYDTVSDNGDETTRAVSVAEFKTKACQDM
ncbi:hypothetical protein ACFV06_00040 [Streptomyces sp. NPDC059618]|uniref:hypothetical protein n=1 Tax=Streptomyces sp. NPDC059618 TaxID=3346887 RepID=UPI003683101E